VDGRRRDIRISSASANPKVVLRFGVQGMPRERSSPSNGEEVRMEENAQDPVPRAARSRLWLAVAAAFVVAAVWAGMALAASRSASKPASSPAAPALMSNGYAASHE
jgi:hypothetical protein